MAIPHASPGQVIDIRPLGGQLPTATTKTLVKTDRLEVIRLVVQAGKEIQPHQVPGEITVQCLEGRVELALSGEKRELSAGEMCYLSGGMEHAVKGLEDSSLLLTIQL